MIGIMGDAYIYNLFSVTVGLFSFFFFSPQGTFRANEYHPY